MGDWWPERGDREPGLAWLDALLFCISIAATATLLWCVL